MTENIELQQVMVDGMILKMCRDDISIHIICGMLDGGEIINLMLMRHHDDTARMLSGRSLYTGTAFRQPLHLTAALVNSALLKIFHHIAVGGLLRQRADGPGPEGGAFSKDDLHIFVGLGLVLPGKV